jgi:hypothetical protein
MALALHLPTGLKTENLRSQEKRKSRFIPAVEILPDFVHTCMALRKKL